MTSKLREADFLIENVQAIVTGAGTLRAGVAAALNGTIVYLGPVADLPTHVTRRKGAMRIDASGCSVLPSGDPLTAGAPLDVLIVKGDPGMPGDGGPPGEAGEVRMEIARGKIVRWS